MSDYVVKFHTTVSLSVDVEADDELDASEVAWNKAEEYLRTVIGNAAHDVRAEASLDGVGDDSIEEATR